MFDAKRMIGHDWSDKAAQNNIKFCPFESRFKEEEFSEVLTRAKCEEMNKDLLRETIEPVPEVLEDDDLTKKEIDEIVPDGSPTKIPEVQSPFGDYTGGDTQERKGEMGDNMRCLYTKMMMPRSVHCSEQCCAAIEMSVERGDSCDVAVSAQIQLVSMLAFNRIYV